MHESLRVARLTAGVLQVVHLDFQRTFVRVVRLAQVPLTYLILASLLGTSRISGSAISSTVNGCRIGGGLALLTGIVPQATKIGVLGRELRLVADPVSRLVGRGVYPRWLAQYQRQRRSKRSGTDSRERGVTHRHLSISRRPPAVE